MSKIVKKIVKPSNPVATLTPISVKRAKTDTAVVVPKKKQINPATLPPLSHGVDISLFKTKMLETQKSTAARTKYEKFVNELDLTEYPGVFDRVSFGDLLNVTPSLPTNKRKLDQLLNIDEKIASVYEEAQETYQSLLNKTESAKINDFAKRKKLAHKKPTATKKPKGEQKEKEEQPEVQKEKEKQPEVEKEKQEQPEVQKEKEEQPEVQKEKEEQPEVQAAVEQQPENATPTENQ